jgi:hypothetical protein
LLYTMFLVAGGGAGRAPSIGYNTAFIRATEKL